MPIHTLYMPLDGAFEVAISYWLEFYENKGDSHRGEGSSNHLP